MQKFIWFLLFRLSLAMIAFGVAGTIINWAVYFMSLPSTFLFIFGVLLILITGTGLFSAMYSISKLGRKTS